MRLCALDCSAARATNTNRITDSGGIAAHRRLRRRSTHGIEILPGNATSAPWVAESTPIDSQKGSTDSTYGLGGIQGEGESRCIYKNLKAV